MNWTLEQFDPTQREFIEDPYPYYRKLREEDPVHYYAPFGSWWLTRYKDVSMVLSDHTLFMKQPPTQLDEVPSPLQPDLQDLNEIPESMLFLDPPDHTRLRSLVTKAFTPRVVENLRPRIEEIVRSTIHSAKSISNGKFDLMTEIAFPVPAIVIAEMLGVPIEDRDTFKGWSARIIKGLDGTQPPGVLMDAAKADLELANYFSKLIEQRRRNKQNDLLSALITTEEEGRKLTVGEIISTCGLLLVAGHETTTNLIGNGIRALILHPDQLKLLREHQEFMPMAIEELLRFESPVQRTARFASKEMKIGDKTIGKGAGVITLLAAANRDPSVFANPENLDITRKENPHVGFGKGIHYCLGAPLARLEAPIVIRMVLEAFPDLKLGEGKAQWNSNTVIRGLKSLPVEFN